MLRETLKNQNVSRVVWLAAGEVLLLAEGSGCAGRGLEAPENNLREIRNWKGLTWKVATLATWIVQKAISSNF